LRAGTRNQGGTVGVGGGVNDGQAEPVSLAVPDPLAAELPERLNRPASACVGLVCPLGKDLGNFEVKEEPW
jgi:hypothetical protein